MVWHPFLDQGQALGRIIAGGPPDEHGHSFEIASSAYHVGEGVRPILRRRGLLAGDEPALAMTGS